MEESCRKTSKGQTGPATAGGGGESIRESTGGKKRDTPAVAPTETLGKAEVTRGRWRKTTTATQRLVRSRGCVLRASD
jgi:hypothetical protein